MADDLMDFSEFGGNENDENVDPEVELAPKLMQTPVVKHSILKQSTKDNLIQLFTPVNKSKKLKVHFTPSIQTPSVGNITSAEALPTVEDSSSQETQEEDEERANWVERTCILTKQDHQDYSQYAREFLLDIIANLPLKEEESSRDSGIDESMMDTQESQDDTTHHSNQQPPAEAEKIEAEACVETESCVDVLSEAEDLLKLLRAQTGTSFNPPDTKDKAVASNDAAEETNDCEDEPMDVDVSIVQPLFQENGPATDPEYTATNEDDKKEIKLEKESNVSEIQAFNDSSMAEPKSLKLEESNVEQDANKVRDNENEVQVSDVDVNQVTKTADKTDSNVEDNTQYSEVKTKVVEIFDDSKEVSHETETVEHNPINIVVTDTENVSSLMETSVSEKAEFEGNQKVLSTTDDEKVVEKNNDHVAKDNDQSSDEEFISADEDVISQEENEPGLVESPGRTPPKVGYNLNFEDFESLNPFQTKSCVQNSPDVISKDKQKLNVKKVERKKQNKKIKVAEVKEEGTEVPTELRKPSLETDGDLTVSSTDSNIGDSVKNNLDRNMGTDVKTESTDQEMPLSSENQSQETSNVDEPSIPDKTLEELAQSPPLPKRGTYNLDDLDSMDPFKPKKQMVNSPAGSQKEGKQATVEETDPFKPRKQIVNSPIGKVIDLESETISEQNKSASEDMKEENSEPSKPKIAKIKKKNTQAEKNESADNLPEYLDEIDPFRSGNKMMNSPVVKPSSYELLPDDLDSLDPFKPKKQMMASPLVQMKSHSNEKISVENETKTVEGSDSKTGDLPEKSDIDPFKPSNNSPAANSLPENLQEIDPFKPKKQILNSPDKLSQNAILPECLEDLDPFKPNKQITNSPSDKNVSKKDQPESTDEINSKSSDKIMKSPNADSDEPGLPDSLEDADPFKPKSQISNSPDKGSLMNLPENFDDIDPFKPGKQMMNSPLGSNDKNMPLDLDSIDPFKSKNKVPNSPDLITDLKNSFDNIDPFNPRNQMKNSPVAKENTDLSEKTEENVKIDIEKANDAFDDIDPFKPKSQMQNSPKKTLEDNFDTVDPFKPRNQMLNSPIGRRLKSSSGSAGTPKTVLSPFLNRNNRLPATPEETLGADGEVMEVQGVTRRGAAGATNSQGFDIDESEFVAASEVFKEPGVWEMLEQFGNSAANPSQDSALSRMSFYVMFDPLVEGISRLSTNPRRISIRPKQLEKVKEYGLDETLLLLGTPPKKKRQSMNVSQLRHTPVTTGGVPAEERHKPRELNMGQGAVDLIMALSPEGDGMIASSKPSSLLPNLDDDDSGSGLFEELKYTDSDLRRLRNDFKLEFQGLLIAKEKEWCKKEQQFENMLKEARTAIDAKEKQIQDMVKACVMFEETVEQMKAIQEKERNQTADIKKENQQLSEDIKGLENAFSDLHRRYEKLKTVVVGNVKNEEILKKYASDVVEKLKKSEEKYATLKKTAEEKISKSTQENAKLKDEISTDTDRHEAAKKMMTIKIENLEKQLQQKIEENKNLTEICDQLIQKAETRETRKM